LAHLSNPLFDHQINVPDGVNMMATRRVGARHPVGAADAGLRLGACPISSWSRWPRALTATSWYFVLSRRIVASRPRVHRRGLRRLRTGDGLAEQRPPNVACQLMVPLILLQLVLLRDPARPVRVGLVLGLFVTYQAFINEEVLLFTAVAGALLIVVVRA